MFEGAGGPGGSYYDLTKIANESQAVVNSDIEKIFVPVFNRQERAHPQMSKNAAAPTSLFDAPKRLVG